MPIPRTGASLLSDALSDTLMGAMSRVYGCPSERRELDVFSNWSEHMQLDTSDRQRALNFIKEDFPEVHATLHDKWDQNFQVGFIGNRVGAARAIGIEVDGEVLNLAFDCNEVLRRGLSFEDGQSEHKEKIAEFMRRKFG
jgi:hypothetical protein